MEATEAKTRNANAGSSRWKSNSGREGAGDEPRGAKEEWQPLPGRQVLRVAGSKGPGSTPPGVDGNPRKASGKQWGAATGSEPGGARDGCDGGAAGCSGCRRRGGERGQLGR